MPAHQRARICDRRQNHNRTSRAESPLAPGTIHDNFARCNPTALASAQCVAESSGRRRTSAHHLQIGVRVLGRHPHNSLTCTRRKSAWNRAIVQRSAVVAIVVGRAKWAFFSCRSLGRNCQLYVVNSFLDFNSQVRLVFSLVFRRKIFRELSPQICGRIIRVRRGWRDCRNICDVRAGP